MTDNLAFDAKPDTAGEPAGDVTSGSPLFYLNGRRMLQTDSSVPISSSRWLNDARIKDWVSTESLRRNGHDYPLLFGAPTLVKAITEVRDYDRIDRLIREERARNPALDAWFGEGFISSYGREDLRDYKAGSIGRALYDYMVDHDLSPELNSRKLADPNWKPERDIDYYDIRMGQTHDFYHILGEVGFGVVAEYFITGVTTGNVFRHVGPELAGEFQTINTLIMFPWMMRTMLHYPAAWPTLYRNLSYGYEIGQQSDMLFTAKYEDILHLTPAEARDALGWRGFRGPTDSREASIIFGEGREIL
ncbi:hypothetical protein [Sphingomonas crocodyli]|uniref:Ubiquinone biosynthesis protein n=1 Tax=Sphingomonas crocodyli TaxID=1979270 RepID=A0A437M011_9SPHN|nr:hypothetical protein [Sphingomonas crocodyli]RVT91020.1 hypothetical protein EOD43_15935 [Sphingomonas crocodyli]